jgi:hypothetical protein
LSPKVNFWSQEVRTFPSISILSSCQSGSNEAFACCISLFKISDFPKDVSINSASFFDSIFLKTSIHEAMT